MARGAAAGSRSDVCRRPVSGGKKDFSTFGRPVHGDNTIRTVFRAEWECPAEVGCFREGRLLVFEIEADAFLYRMVRSLVGALVRVGLGELSAQEFESLLQARDRSQIRLRRPPRAYALCGWTMMQSFKELCSEDFYRENSKH